MDEYSSRIHIANNGSELHIGGQVIIEDGADLTALAEALQTVGKTSVCDLSQEFNGKKYSDMVSEDTKVTYGGVVIGTMKYVEGYTAFGGDEQNGYFFPFHLGDDYKGKTITVKRISGEGGKEKQAADQDWVLRLTDGEDTVYEIKDGTTLITNLSFKQATFNPLAISTKARQSVEEDKDELYGQTLDDLVADKLTVYADGTVKGTLKYVERYGSDALTEEQQSGYFAPIHFEGIQGKSFTVQRVSGTPGEVKSSSTLDSVVFRLQDGIDTVYEVKVEGKYYINLKFSGVKFYQ